MRRKLRLQALEPRVLLDAAGVATAADGLLDPAVQAAEFETSQQEYKAQQEDNTRATAPTPPSGRSRAG